MNLLHYVAIINTSIWHKYYTKISSISVSSINIVTVIFVLQLVILWCAPVIRVLHLLNPSQTYIATALRPLRDWQFFTDRRGRNKVPDRSRRGCREVGDWSGTSLRPNQSQAGFCACTKTWLRLIWSQTGPGEVADQSPISRRLVADRSPTNFVRIGAWLSLKLVGDWSAIGRRLVGDRSATNRGPLRDITATSWRPVPQLVLKFIPYLNFT